MAHSKGSPQVSALSRKPAFLRIGYRARFLLCRWPVWLIEIDGISLDMALIGLRA